MVQRDTRTTLLEAAAEVVAQRGIDGASTREIYRRAGVRAPTLYHHFGSRQGLMEALVNEAFARYLAGKRSVAKSGDPYVDLRRGWDVHIGFARKNPTLYPLMFQGGAGEPAAAKESRRLLREAFDEIAAEGHLQPELTPELAARSLSAALRGVATAVATNPKARGNSRMSELVRDAVIAALLLPS